MKLSEYLAANNLSNRAFADQIGVTAEAVRLYAAGLRQPRVRHMRAIVAVTKGKVTAQDLFDAASDTEGAAA